MKNLNDLSNNNKKKIFGLSVGIGCFLLIFACILWRYKGFFSLISIIIRVLRPIIIGTIIAFILNPLFRKLDDPLIRFSKKITSHSKENVQNFLESFLRGLALLVLYTTTFSLIFLIGSVIIPEFSNSVMKFSSNFDSYQENLDTFIQKHQVYLDNDTRELIQGLKLEEKLLNMLSYIPNFVDKTISVTLGVFSFLIDFIVGIIFSVYILASKHGLKAQSIKIFKAFLSDRHYEKFSSFISESAHIFSSYIVGQMTEACLIGAFCFIGMSIFGFEYAILISVLIGLTNMIPVVGPFIGTVPSAFLLLMVNPKSVIPFLIFIIILQQLESNLLYPNVVGSVVELPSIWVLASVLVGGGLFGIPGMILSVPTCSIIRKLILSKADECIDKKTNQLCTNIPYDAICPLDISQNKIKVKVKRIQKKEDN